MLLKYILSNKYKVKDIKVILGCEDTSRHKVIKYLMCCWVSKNTELGFVSFSSRQFTRMAVCSKSTGRKTGKFHLCALYLVGHT